MNKYILCCDWGTTSFRLRLVDRYTYEVIAELLSPGGVAGTFRSWKEQTGINRFDYYSDILRASILSLGEKAGLNLENIPVTVSGMASSSLGMEEIPYAELPFNISGSQASVKIYENFNGPAANLVLVSGLKSYEDVMRGEEAQLIGLIKIKDEQVTDFKTFMTGEIFNILSEHSILKDSIELNKTSGLTEPEDIEAFKQGVEVSGSSSLLHNLFTVRTMQLFGKFSKEQNSYYLSGLLIGTELRQLYSGNYDHLVICSGKHLFDHYKIAVEMLSFKIKTNFIQSDLIDKATIAGQVQLFNALQTVSNE